mmetsp:Transcript_8001/g.17842  ORF Transcript_8001/g.17842 Transcript_8001/m.17842 type:complete len:216 (+) Transcript_8001:563-1210(+)
MWCYGRLVPVNETILVSFTVVQKIMLSDISMDIIGLLLDPRRIFPQNLELFDQLITSDQFACRNDITKVFATIHHENCVNIILPRNGIDGVSERQVPNERFQVRQQSSFVKYSGCGGCNHFEVKAFGSIFWIFQEFAPLLFGSSNKAGTRQSDGLINALGAQAGKNNGHCPSGDYMAPIHCANLREKIWWCAEQGRKRVWNWIAFANLIPAVAAV